MEDLSKFQRLTDIQHVKIRPGMYLGSVETTEREDYVLENGKFVRKIVRYNPALLKMFDEIISNSVDEHIKNGSVKNIWVSFDQIEGNIIVKDDGGIPVQKHPEYGIYIPSMIFGELRTGSNFSDNDRYGAGMNGLGAKLTSIFSDYFKVETCDGKNYFSQTFFNGLSEKSEPIVHAHKTKGTTITFSPDCKILGIESIFCDNNMEKIIKRVYDVAGCNPKINVHIEGKLIKVNNFSDYVKLYTNDKEIVEFSNDEWSIAVAASSDDTFRHVSFVNGVDTFNGGTHVDYIANQIANKLRDYITKKHKLDVKPNNIKQQMTVFINSKVNAPTFTSQTKEFMSLDVKNYGTSCELPDAYINKLIKSEVMQNVMDWIENEKRKRELAELRKLNKETQKVNYLRKIVKFEDATSKNRSECVLCLTEGDSAAKPILSCRDARTMGVFPLRGKPLNVRDIEISKLTKNEEFSHIMSIIGLKLGHEDMKIEDLRFSRVLVCSDADNDGSHIFGLILNMFQQFWPNLLKEGLLYRLQTPVILATKGKKEFEFFDRKSYDSWKVENPDHQYKFFKGLGTWKTEYFKKFINEPKYQRLMVCDENAFASIDLAFDKRRADDRKVWLAKK